MRRTIWAGAITLLIAAPVGATAHQAAQSSQTQSQTKTQTGPAQTSSGQTSSVGDRARKVRQDQKGAPKPVVFTNENLPRSSTISVVGKTGPATNPAKTQAQAAADEKSDERMWRQKFADARYKLVEDRQKLSILESELNSLGMVRYFNEDDVASKQQAIADQQKQISADQKALDDLADSLRKAGGDPAWAR